MGSGGGQQQSSQQSKPLPITDPYISQYLSDLGILDNPFSGTQVPQQQVAGLSGLQKLGVGSIPGEAGQAAQLGGQANQTAGSIIGGANLGPGSNPALAGYLNTADQQLINQYQNSTAPNITAGAVAQGGLGGSGANQAQQYGQNGIGQNLATTNADILNNAYNTGIGQQTSVLGMAPGLQSSAFTPSSGEISGGNLTQQQQQNVLNTLYQNQQNQFQQPFTQLNAYGAGTQGIAGLGGQQVSFAPGAGSVK